MNARLDAARAAKLSALRRETGVSVTEILEEAIDVLYEQKRKQQRGPAEVLKRAGFIACGEGPENLSETAKADFARLMEQKHGDG